MIDLFFKVGYFDPAFDEWERILTWKPPKLDCPDGMDPKVQLSIPIRIPIRSSNSSRHGSMHRHICQEPYRPTITVC